MKKTIITHSDKDTEQLGQKIGANLRGGEVLLLISDLGGGKTTLTRGIAKGAGSAAHVSSPTFMISQLYQAEDLNIYHYDLYRLPELGLVKEQLNEELSDPKNVIIIEWPEQAVDLFPPERTLRLSIRLVKASEDDREIVADFSDTITYLLGEPK